MPAVRHLFAMMLVLSVLVHAGTVTWFNGRGEAMPRALPRERGEWSIALQASVEAVRSESSSEPVDTTEPDEPLPPNERRTSLSATEPPVPERTTDRPEIPLPSPPTSRPEIAQNTPTPIVRVPAWTKPAEDTDPRPMPSVQPEEIKRSTLVDSLASAGSKASRGADADELPRAKFNPTPPYPAGALSAGQQGTVLLRVKVSAAGTVESVVVHRSSGVASLDESAATTIRRWQFHPARRKDEAVPLEVEVPVRFVIRHR